MGSFSKLFLLLLHVPETGTPIVYGLKLMDCVRKGFIIYIYSFGMVNVGEERLKGLRVHY